MKKLLRTLLALPSEFRVVPVRGKIPLKRGWNNPACNYSPVSLTNTIIKYRGRFFVPSKKHQKLLVLSLTGIGLVCGEYPHGFLIAIDCDTPEAIALLKQLQLPQSVSFTSGRENRQQILYYLDRPIPNFCLSLGMEIRGSNRLSILPPSIHPLTRQEYYWLNHPRDKKIAKIDSQTILDLKPQQNKVQQYIQPKIADRNKAIELMPRIDTTFGSDYHNWIAIGMALHSIDPDLLPVWDAWSSKCHKYIPQECQYKWQSFKNRPQGYTIATLYYFAKQSTLK